MAKGSSDCPLLSSLSRLGIIPVLEAKKDLINPIRNGILLKLTAKSLFSIANRGGPRCCKRDSFLAIIEAVEFMKEHFKINLPIKEKIGCSFFDLNTECLHEHCKFYQQ